MRLTPKKTFLLLLTTVSVCFFARAEITPIIGHVLTEPKAAQTSDGKYLVSYELIVANAVGNDYYLKEIKVINSAKGDKLIKKLCSDEIKRQIHIPGREKLNFKLPAGKSGYIKIDLIFDSKKAIPKEVDHIIIAKTDTPSPLVLNPAVSRIGRTNVSAQQGVVIGPPLRGKNWVACAVGKEGYHRSAVLPIDGNWVVAERWAVDWVQFDQEKRLLTGPLEDNRSYPQYGEEIIAVADGLIVSTQDGLPDIPAGEIPQLKDLDQAAGNYIIQEIEEGLYALYAHLQPGSLRVNEADRVKKGQTIALLGNSGNSSGPHLHFQVMSGKSVLGSDGVPYVIDSFYFRGIALSDDLLETELKSGQPLTIKSSPKDGPIKEKMPANLAVIDFKK